MPLDETIFLTGFPGFIAGRLVERLARAGARFQLLVQPALVTRAHEDLARVVAETGASPRHFRLVEGDITREGLGLSPEDAAAARSEATALFHLAAVYDLAVARDVATAVNVEGTRHVNRFAQIVEVGGQALDHPLHPAIPETRYLKAFFCRAVKE